MVFFLRIIKKQILSSELFQNSFIALNSLHEGDIAKSSFNRHMQHNYCTFKKIVTTKNNFSFSQISIRRFNFRRKRIFPYGNFIKNYLWLRFNYLQHNWNANSIEVFFFYHFKIKSHFLFIRTCNTIYYIMYQLHNYKHNFLITRHNIKVFFLFNLFKNLQSTQNLLPSN